MPAGGFHGGLRLEGRKEAASRPIRRCPLPALLRIALRQHPGAPARPVVRLGERVAAGQRLASGDGAQSADLHAPCSGEVVAIESRCWMRRPPLPSSCASGLPKPA
jgi:electron transport complex protein RnfC